MQMSYIKATVKSPEFEGGKPGHEKSKTFAGDGEGFLFLGR